MTSTKKWVVTFSKNANKNFGQLEKKLQKIIMSFLEDRLLPAENPRLLGKQLTGKLSPYWRYRVGDYRIVVDIRDHALIILVIALDHRRQVYK